MLVLSYINNSTGIKNYNAQVFQNFNKSLFCLVTTCVLNLLKYIKFGDKLFVFYPFSSAQLDMFKKNKYYI